MDPLTMLLGGGSLLTSILGGILNKPKPIETRTDASSSGTSSASTRRALLPQQEALLDPVLARISSLYSGTGLGEERATRRNLVNRDYMGFGDAAAEALLAHGGRSGKYGQALQRANLSRLGGLQGVDSDISRMRLQQQSQGDDLLTRFLGMSFGADTTGQESQQSHSQSVQRGGAPSASQGLLAASGGLGSLASLVTLQRLLGGASSTGDFGGEAMR